jgi:hypothetical protein
VLNGRIHPQPGFEIKTFQIFYCPQNFTLYLFFFIRVVYGIVRTVPPCSTHNNSAHSTPRLTDLIFLYGFCFVYAHLNAVGMNKKQHDKKEKVLTGTWRPLLRHLGTVGTSQCHAGVYGPCQSGSVFRAIKNQAGKPWLAFLPATAAP